MGYLPRRGDWHDAPINVKFGMGEQTPCQFSRSSGQKCGNTAPKTAKIVNFGYKFAPKGSLVCTVFTKFSAFVRVSK